jgi:hypothetical protein
LVVRGGGISTGAIQFGEDVDTIALYAGGGTNASPLATSTADKNHFDYRTQSTATSGTSRGIYHRHYMAFDGECARFFGTQNGTSTGGTHGIHASLSFGTSGVASGLGAAVRATLQIPNRTVTLGTVAGLQAEVWMDGTSSNPTATCLSIIRGVVDGGDATAQNKVTHVMDLANLGAAIFANQAAWSVSKVLKIRVNGTDYYLPLSTAA